MKISRLMCGLLPLLALSCADSGGPVVVDAEWNLRCPQDSAVGCGSLAEETCLGAGGRRAILGEHRQMACTGDPIIAICEAVERSDGRFIAIEANIGDEFAFELGAKIVPDGSVEQSSCNVTIIEDEVPYDIGACGEEEPSMAQPCQLSNVSTEGNEVIFDLECASLLSSTTGFGFDVGAAGGEPTTIRFRNCTGF